MTREEQVASAKTMLWMFWWLSIFAIPAPITARPGQSYSELFVVLSLLPAFTILAGTHRLLFPNVAVRWAFAVHLGLVATILFLLFAPSALRIAIASLEYKPMWLVTTAIGTSGGLAYIYMYVKRFVRAKPPNKSLERTREG
jgi:hypothetical protein